MKVKKFIGQSINGFTILDTYAVNLPSGKKTNKVLLKCDQCGLEFERCSSQNFDHVKCKCMCEYLKPKQEKFHWVEYNGERIILKDFCKKYGLNVNSVSSQLNRGWTAQECIDGVHLYKLECKKCGMWFESKMPNRKFCSKTCERRHARGHNVPQPAFHVCDVCHAVFISARTDAQCCSQECRRQLSRIDRNGRYRHLKKIGRYDPSVTLVNVFNRFDGTCCVCGEKLSFEGNFRSDNYPSMDHIVPLSKGGVHEWNNIQLLCRKCNCLKGAG